VLSFTLTRFTTQSAQKGVFSAIANYRTLIRFLAVAFIQVNSQPNRSLIITNC